MTFFKVFMDPGRHETKILFRILPSCFSFKTTLNNLNFDRVVVFTTSMSAKTQKRLCFSWFYAINLKFVRNTGCKFSSVIKIHLSSLIVIENCHKNYQLQWLLAPKDALNYFFLFFIDVEHLDVISCKIEGSPLYLAPEIITRDAVGTSVDVWACAVVMYMLLVG